MDEKARELLQRAADSLQEYCEDVNGDMNDSLAMEIYDFLEVFIPVTKDTNAE